MQEENVVQRTIVYQGSKIEMDLPESATHGDVISALVEHGYTELQGGTISVDEQTGVYTPIPQASKNGNC